MVTRRMRRGQRVPGAPTSGGR